MVDYESKRIDIALEEYKALRTEIITLIQNRNNIIIFGFAGLVTLISVGVTVFTSSLPPLEVSQKTTTTTNYSSVRKSITANTPDTTTKTELTDPDTVTETEKPTEVKPIKPEQYRGTASAIVFGVFVPLSCMYISFFWVRNTRRIFLIGNYIANNIEKKINIIYLKEEKKNRIKDLVIMPLNWETYMSAQKFPRAQFEGFINTYGFIALCSVLFGIVIIYLIGLWINIVIVVVIAIIAFKYIQFIKKERNGLQEIRSEDYVKEMKGRIHFKLILKEKIDHATIVAWKSDYVEEFGKLKELEEESLKKYFDNVDNKNVLDNIDYMEELKKPFDIMDELAKNPVKVPGIRSITREEMHERSSD